MQELEFMAEEMCLEKFIDEVEECIKYYECKNCTQCRYDNCTGKYYCRRSYSDISPEQWACDDFELDG